MTKSDQSYKSVFIHSHCISMVRISDIQLHPNQLKIQTEDKVAYLIHTIEAIGYYPTITLDESLTILDGHAVFMAVQALGFKEIPVIVIENASEREKELFMYAACDTAHMIQWQQSNIRNPWEIKHV